MEDAPRNPMLSAWTRRADAMLHLTFAAAAGDPLALMTLGHQHYFHSYKKEDQTSYPWPTNNAATNGANGAADGANAVNGANGADGADGGAGNGDGGVDDGVDGGAGVDDAAVNDASVGLDEGGSFVTKSCR